MMKIEYRTLCSVCGACAGHEEDRVDGRCHHCGNRETVQQQRLVCHLEEDVNHYLDVSEWVEVVED